MVRLVFFSFFLSFLFFFNWIVFLFWGGGILNKFIAVRYPCLVLEISFYSRKLGPKVGGWADRKAQGREGPLSPRPLAGAGLCGEPLGSEGSAAGSFQRQSPGDGPCAAEASPQS